MNFRKLLAGFAVAAGALLTSLPAPASLFSNITVFGDSLSDTGNNAQLVDAGLLLPAFPPGARTPVPLSNPVLIPTVPYASDRYSNGPVWIDQFASAVGLSSANSGFPLLPGFPGGTNFAFGSARTGPDFVDDVPTLTQQFDFFLGTLGGPTVDSGALYVVFGGGNDARDIAFAAPADRPQMIIDYVTNIAGIVGGLRALGADHILVANTPDIGKIPAVRALSAVLDPLNPTALADQVSALVAFMNFQVDAALAPIGGLWHLDTYGLLNQVFADPTAFGLTDATTACAASAACIADPDQNFFWDGIHPTTAGHALLAAAALQAIPEPGMIAVFALGLAMLVVVRRRLG